MDKESTRIYLDSYIVFVYKYLDNVIAFKNELEKYTKILKKDEAPSIIEGGGNEPDSGENKMGDLNVSNVSKKSVKSIGVDPLLNNIKVITSDVCGLGKSFKIKKMIKELGKKYLHFPLGGKLTKNEIYQRLAGLFENIKKEAKEEAKKEAKEKAKKKSKDKEDKKDRYKN